MIDDDGREPTPTLLVWKDGTPIGRPQYYDPVLRPQYNHWLQTLEQIHTSHQPCPSSGWVYANVAIDICNRLQPCLLDGWMGGTDHDGPGIWIAHCATIGTACDTYYSSM